MKLTAAMRDTLDQAARRQEGLRRVHDDKPGRPPWPAHPATLAALVRHGLLVREELRHRKGWKVDVWRITDPGRDALKPEPVLRRDSVSRLRVGSGTTITMQGGVWVETRIPEPERMDEVWLKRFASDAELARFVGRCREEDMLLAGPLGRRLANARYLALKRGVNVRDQLQVLEHRARQGRLTEKTLRGTVEAMERKIRDQQPKAA